MDAFLADDRPIAETRRLPADSPSQFGMIPVEDRARTLYPHAETVSRDRIQQWSDKSLEPSPGYPEYEGIRWNLKWLTQGKLVCSTQFALKMKSLAALHPEVRQITDLLEMAIWYGIPFAIFVKRSSMREYRDVMIAPLVLQTMSTTYEPGFQDVTLEWSRVKGSASAFNLYKSNIGILLSCPEAAAIVACGGVMRFMAEIFDPDIVRCYALGPSLQVSQFNRGESRLFRGQSGEEFWTTKLITASEKNILLGHIVGDNQDSDRTFPEVFEAGSSHMRGYLSTGALKILNGLKYEYFQDPPNLHWYTPSQWHRHFRNGRTGRFKDTEPLFIPDKAHWAEGKELFDGTYPKNWEAIDLCDIQIPEVYEPKL
ncbi:hypothetical protein K438DRAFT_1783376 [Mycena galopus ATCC 62051]|nr:hypothetical protein K438DRAFT_1783376 [Mycena galopus ATCC 62051]